MKKYPRLILVFTAILVVVCRCDATPDIKRNVPQTQGGSASCWGIDFFVEDGYVSGWDTTCTAKCPDGSTRLIKIRDASFPSEIITDAWCGVTPTARPSRTPTVAPTATPSATPPAPISLFTGDVTACSLKDGFINFRLMADGPPIGGPTPDPGGD